MSDNGMWPPKGEPANVDDVKFVLRLLGLHVMQMLFGYRSGK